MVAAAWAEAAWAEAAAWLPGATQAAVAAWAEAVSAAVDLLPDRAQAEAAWAARLQAVRGDRQWDRQVRASAAVGGLVLRDQGAEDLFAHPAAAAPLRWDPDTGGAAISGMADIGVATVVIAATGVVRPSGSATALPTTIRMATTIPAGSFGAFAASGGGSGFARITTDRAETSRS